MTTRKDVALLAGVSPSTVSYVISGERAISQETRERVERAMRDLDYTPNAIARSLAGARKCIVAIHFPSQAGGLHTTQFEYLSAAAQRARTHRFNTLLWTEDVEDIGALRELIGSRMLDGLLLMEVRIEDPRIPVLRAAGIPFALIGRPDDVGDMVCVDNDFVLLADQAIDHLADLGHREALYLALPVEDLDFGHGLAVRTLRALEEAARRRGIRLSLFHTANATRGGHEAFAHLESMTPRPTAVVGSNELAVAGLLRAASIAGVSIPNELTVVGLNVADVAADMLTPGLTTVSPPAATLATMAMDALVDQIAGRHVQNRMTLIAPVLTVRGSSAPVYRTRRQGR